MLKKVPTYLIALLVLAFAVTACGDEESESGSGGSGSAPAQTDDSSGGSTGGNEEAAKAAREGCEAGIKGNPAIDAGKQEELSAECEKVADAAASGDKEEFKKAYTDYCNKLAEALPEQARAPAKDACLQGANAMG